MSHQSTKFAPYDPDIYQEWKRVTSQPAGTETMDRMQAGNSFSVGNEEPMELVKAGNSFSVGNEPMSASPSMDWGSAAGAGIQAAGQAASAIAQAAGQKAANDQMVAGNAANRASSEKMAMASLLQNSKQFDGTQQMDAYSAMLSALSAAGNNTMQQRALNRSITRAGADGLTTAFLGA